MKRHAMRRQGDGHYLGLLAIALALSSAGFVHAQEKQTWQWSPSQPYHHATVKVWQDDEYTGSGVLIGANKKKTLGYVLTALHVVEKDDFAGVEWENKTRSAGKIILRDEEHDLAIVTCDPPNDATVAAVAGKLPNKGEVCDHTGWGGAEPVELRTFYGQYMHTEDSTYTNTSAIEGDSGGGVWFDGALIGIIAGGRYKVVNGEDLNFPIRSAPLDAIKALCTRVSEMPPAEVLSAQRAVPPNYFEFLGADVVVERRPEGTRIQVERGVRVPDPPSPVEVTPPAAAPPAASQTVTVTPAPVAAPSVAQVVSIDTGLISKAVVEHIVKHDLIPPQKVDDAELVIRIATRLKDDEEFANLVAAKVMAKVEARILKRIGEAISGESKQ